MSTKQDWQSLIRAVEAQPAKCRNYELVNVQYGHEFTDHCLKKSQAVLENSTDINLGEIGL